MKYVERARKLFWLFCLTLLFLTACSQDKPPQNEPEEEQSGPIETETDEEEMEARPVAPLTGMVVDEPIERRIIGVMIDNAGPARPQSGLGQADMVYEILAEGDITRYLALFHSEIPDVIGPVRSLRPYYLDIARGYDAIIAHAGGSPAAKEEVDRTSYPSIDGTRSGGFAFYRTDHRRAPHNLYIGREKLLEGEERFGYNKDYSLPKFTFAEEGAEPDGKQATQVTIKYAGSYQVAYEYDAAQGLYTRYVKGEAHTDEQTGEAIVASNVLVIETGHQVIDNAGRRVVDVSGEGRGYLFQRGKVQEITWKNVDGLIRPMINGEEVPLYPGPTWVNIIPDQPGLETNVTYSQETP